MPRGCEVHPLGKKTNAPNLIKRRGGDTLRLLKSVVRTNLLPTNLWRRSKEFVLAFLSLLSPIDWAIEGYRVCYVKKTLSSEFHDFRYPLGRYWILHIQALKYYWPLKVISLLKCHNTVDKALYYCTFICCNKNILIKSNLGSKALAWLTIPGSSCG